MVVTGLIAAGVIIYAIWAIQKIRQRRKNGCCGGSGGGSCPSCALKENCGK